VEQAGIWVLEIVRHVNLGQDLVRPTTQRLSGHRTITAYFNSNPDKALLGKATQRLMQTEGAGAPRSYTVVGSEWIASSVPPPRAEPGDSEAPRPIDPTLEANLADLKGQVVLLAAVQEGLLVRLARLESKIRQGGVRSRPTDELSEPALEGSPDSLPPDNLDGVEGAEAGSSPGNAEPWDASAAEMVPEAADHPPVESAPESAAAGATPATPAPAHSPNVVAPSEAAPGASSPGAAPPSAPGLVAEKPAEERREVALPPGSELGRCIALLLGGNVSAEDAPAFPVNRVTKDCYAAPIQDESARTVGLILLDLKATVFLGGTLMMVPKSELDQQIVAASPGEDSIAAAAEICNALAGAINGFEQQSVHIGPLEKFDFKSCSWVTDPVDRRDLLDSFGGRTAILSRRLHQAPIG
jgi:hypothetical protein